MPRNLLINHPQVAILSMARTRLEPVAEGSLDDFRLVPRLRMPLVLGFDHRVNDGADAARFVTALIETLSDPESLLLAA